MLKLMLGICIGALIVIIAVQLHERKTRTIPMSSIKTEAFHKNPVASGDSIGPIGHLHAVVDGSVPSKAELQKAIHESTKTKAADKEDAGDW